MQNPQLHGGGAAGPVDNATSPPMVKGEKEDLSEFKPTEYWNAVQNFQKFIVAEGRKGFPPSVWAKPSI